MWWLVVSLVLLWRFEALAVPPPPSVSCKDENDNSVDWYILYKAPSITPLTGLEYIYIDPRGKRVMSPSHRPYKSISHSNGVLANTLRLMLSSVRNMPGTFGFLSYSDQPPGCSANIKKFGHSKGVVLGDSDTNSALWLTHSTPQFPFRRNQNAFWPVTGNDNGQTFMCVTTTYTDLKIIGEHLQQIRAFPFDYDLPPTFPKELIDAASWVHASAPSGFKSLNIRGKELKIMAKQIAETAEDGDLYVALAAGFSSDVFAQTWGCQPNADPDFCDIGRHKVLNVETIRTDLEEWSSQRDHSKWAVTTDNNIAWTCFGDVNRARSQYGRFGGALCIQDTQVNSVFKGFVSDGPICGKRRRECNDEMFSPIIG